MNIMFFIHVNLVIKLVTLKLEKVALLRSSLCITILVFSFAMETYEIHMCIMCCFVLFCFVYSG